MIRLRANAAFFWRWFGYWRKRYMWLRLAILLVIFAPTIYEIKRPLIRQLVVYAVTAIDTARFPTPFVKDRLLRAQQTKALEKSLIARFDANRDGRLDVAESRRLAQATGLSAKDVTADVLHADYDRLLAGAQKGRIATRFGTSREMRNWAYRTAQTQEAQWHDQQWAEVERELEMPRVRPIDYLHWSTWARGIGWFRERFDEILGAFIPPIFAGISGPMMAPAPRGWRGYIGWAIILALVMISVRNFARRQELERRFREDPIFAEAPCLICGRPTHDFGALRELRVARSLGVGVVVGLAAFGVAWLGIYDASDRAAFAIHVTPVALAVAAAAVRYILWPREVHACHQRPRLHLIAFIASVIAVVAPLAAVVAMWAGALG
jgi:hypothetical protein